MYVCMCVRVYACMSEANKTENMYQLWKNYYEKKNSMPFSQLNEEHYLRYDCIPCSLKFMNDFQFFSGEAFKIWFFFYLSIYLESRN